jgi:hypothetical protein
MQLSNAKTRALAQSLVADLVTRGRAGEFLPAEAISALLTAALRLAIETSEGETHATAVEMLCEALRNSQWLPSSGN